MLYDLADGVSVFLEVCVSNWVAIVFYVFLGYE